MISHIIKLGLGYLILVAIFVAGYFLGFAKGYNQMVKEIEDMKELEDGQG